MFIQYFILQLYLINILMQVNFIYNKYTIETSNTLTHYRLIITKYILQNYL